jgi:hypothetical protein
MEEIHKLVQLIKRIILEQDERILNVRGGKGYSAGHPYPNKTESRPLLGYVENNDQIETNPLPIKISRAFKKD